jgi:hypothetical protein
MDLFQNQGAKLSNPGSLIALLRMTRKKGIGLFCRSSSHWDWRHAYELINHLQTSNRTSIRLIKADFSWTTL